jgi:hypothetical protein
MTPAQIKRLLKAEACRPEKGESKEIVLARIIQRYDEIAARQRAAGILELTGAEARKVANDFIAYMIDVHGASPLG